MSNRGTGYGDWLPGATGLPLSLPAPLGLAMSRAVKKTSMTVVLCCIFAVFVPAHAAETTAFDPLQPLALNHASVYSLWDLHPHLTGTGVKMALICRSMTYVDDKPQSDYRPNTAHNCLLNTKFTFHDPGYAFSGISPHGTAISSILFGRDPDAFNPELGEFAYQGITPDARANIHQFDHFIIKNVSVQTPLESDVVSASFGIEFEDWWTRGIEALAEHHGMVFVAAIGNGTDAHDPPLYPAAGANVIGVGVVDSVNADDLATRLANFALAGTEHSSYGPTATGRCKPDLVAPGNCLVAGADEPNLYEPAGSYSSFATPVVAGTIGLLVQQAAQDAALAPAVSGEGRNCLIKAILLNSATKLPYWHKGNLSSDDDRTAPLDHIQGAGMVNALAAYNQLVAGRALPGNVPEAAWDKNTLQKNTNPQNVYRITIPDPAGKNITATAVWNNHYADTYPFAAATEKDANLRLELWAVDPNNPGRDYRRDYSDSPIDNLEHIYYSTDPNYTDYEIVLLINDADNANTTDEPQHFGLAWATATVLSTRPTLSCL